MARLKPCPDTNLSPDQIFRKCRDAVQFQSTLNWEISFARVLVALPDPMA
jgi:hypothetical protein